MAATAVVGVDIGASGVRGVEVSRDKRSGRYALRRAASVDLPRGSVRNGVVVDSDTVVAALRQLWRKGRFSTRKVVFGVADGNVLTRQLDLPWMPARDFRAALRYQVTDALPVDLATVQLDYHLLDEQQRTDEHGQPVDVNRILIAATSTDIVLAEAEVVQRARLQPVIADTTAFALIRAACRGLVPDDQAVRAIADLGADQLTVAIHQGGQPRFIRTISNLGGDAATIGVAERLRVPAEQAESIKRECGLNGPAPVVAAIAESSVFSESAAPHASTMNPRSAATVESLGAWATRVIGEIRNSLDYFQASEPATVIADLTVCGRATLLEGMVERIATQLPLPVRVMDPLLGLAPSRKVARQRVSDSRLAVAAGLAMGG